MAIAGTEEGDGELVTLSDEIGARKEEIEEAMRCMEVTTGAVGGSVSCRAAMSGQVGRRVCQQRGYAAVLFLHCMLQRSLQ